MIRNCEVVLPEFRVILGRVMYMILLQRRARHKIPEATGQKHYPQLLSISERNIDQRGYNNSVD
jgi:hypothetical protein